MAPEKGNSLHRDPVGEPGSGFVCRLLRETVKECSINAASLFLSLCLWELCEGKLEGGLFYWEFRKLISNQREARKLISDLSLTV